MKTVFKKLITATITLFSALLLTSIIIQSNLFKHNFKVIIICYVFYIAIYLIIILFDMKLKKSAKKKS